MTRTRLVNVLRVEKKSYPDINLNGRRGRRTRRDLRLTLALSPLVYTLCRRTYILQPVQYDDCSLALSWV